MGYVGENIGWHYGFGLAGMGMLLGLLVYYFGQKYLVNVGNLLSQEDMDAGASFGNLFSNLFKAPLQLGIFLVLMAFHCIGLLPFLGALVCFSFSFL